MFNYFLTLSFLMTFLSYIILIINVLIGVAFLTLYERKLLSYIQLRKGPNKLGFLGLLQPFSDAVKLFSKEYLMGFNFNYFIYLFSPFLMLSLSLMIWFLLPIIFNLWNLNLGILFLLSVLSSSVYTMMYSGWASNSLYSLLGSMRAVAQTISYEVSLALILITLILLVDSFNLLDFLIFQENLSMVLYLFPLFFMFLVSSIAELNRSPFDFAEGESELVSGFNIEYASGMFAFLFLAEYTMILFFSMLWFIMFIGGGLVFNFWYYIYIMLFFSLVVLIRGSYPRFRYDKLMSLTWKVFLPLSLLYVVFMLSIKFLVMFMLI
uniref:NADH-ubiquinone oxidoreductase chain 1 n=1 Tax=Stenocephus fraxini TaxID=2963023 RepID=A0A9E9BYK1_9HYME|nr:NADH dehydrogenase subunit 1 [Stenocephus fraxini]WAK85080.1 NADH dehydrogenase subunit 1 [Stenocephus fraxini]